MHGNQYKFLCKYTLTRYWGPIAPRDRALGTPAQYTSFPSAVCPFSASPFHHRRRHLPVRPEDKRVDAVVLKSNPRSSFFLCWSRPKRQPPWSGHNKTSRTWTKRVTEQLLQTLPNILTVPFASNGLHGWLRDMRPEGCSEESNEFKSTHQKKNRIFIYSIFSRHQQRIAQPQLWEFHKLQYILCDWSEFIQHTTCPRAHVTRGEDTGLFLNRRLREPTHSFEDSPSLNSFLYFGQPQLDYDIR